MMTEGITGHQIKDDSMITNGTILIGGWELFFEEYEINFRIL